MNESIYALIPPEVVPEQRSAMHHSKFRSTSKGKGTLGPPTYSTFPVKVNDITKVGDGSGTNLFAKPAATFGKLVGAEVNPKNFIKAHSSHPPLPEPKITKRDVVTKVAVIKNCEKPVMGLTTEKNYVTSNAVEVICTQPKKRRDPPKLATERADFGKIPKYLSSVKSAISDEKSYLVSLQEEQAADQANAMSRYVYELEGPDRVQLLSQLQEQWNAKHRIYQSLPFAQDTMMQMARKEVMQKELKELEAAMAKLSREVVYVYSDERGVAQWAKTTAMSEAQVTSLQRRTANR